MDTATNKTPDSNVESTQPLYEPPVVVRLGEIGAGAGQITFCQSGSAAGECLTGVAAVFVCSGGSQGGAPG